MNSLAAQDHDKRLSNFSVNLKHLCTFYRSISEVSRKLRINRSQFNKYLTGTSRPSMHILRKIENFFGVEEHELLMPPSQFSQLIEARPRRPAPKSGHGFESHIYDLQSMGSGSIASYEGVYFEYYLSMSYPGYILRSIILLKCTDSGAFYKRIERLSPRHCADRRFRCVYLGIALYLADRIFFVDYESLTRSEISQTIYFPNYKSRKTLLSGLKMGVSANNRHMPISTRSVLEYLGKDVSLRQVLRKCGLFQDSSDSIRSEIKHRIQNTIGDHEIHLTPTALN